MISRRRAMFLAAATLTATLWAGAAKAVPVLDLALVIDASGSIDPFEYELQRQAYANAFESAPIQDLINRAAPLGGIRVTAILFATTARVEIDWTLLTSGSDADLFAAQLRTVSRAGLGTNTSIGRGLQLANQRLAALADPAGRRIIDVSGDGIESVVPISALRAARDDALMNQGVDQINGLVIGSASLEQYYRDNVIGGVDAFVTRVDTFALFQSAIDRKLEIELSAIPVIPEPASVVLFGLGGAAVAGLRLRQRRRRRA